MSGDGDGDGGTAMADDGGDGGSGGDPTDPGGSDGSGGADGGGGDGGQPSDADLDAVEAACEADCEAQFATECPPANQNVLTCKLNCAVITVQLGSFCLPEYVDTVQCRADGGYDCLMGYPYPKSTCALEQQTFAECSADIGCKRYCADAVDEGCSDSFDGCVDECLGEKAAAPGYCGTYIDSWRMCESQLGIVCSGPTDDPNSNCNYGLGSYADCIADEANDPCLGYCYVADELACGADCSTVCANRLSDPNCGQQWSSLVDCELRHADFQCTDGTLLGVGICDYETTNYQECLAGVG